MHLEFFPKNKLVKKLFCKNESAAQDWFILIILFGVFTNKHMQEVDDD